MFYFRNQIFGRVGGERGEGERGGGGWVECGFVERGGWWWWWWCGLNVVRACLSIHAHACNELKWTSASALVPSAGLTSRKKPYALSLRRQVPGVPESKSFTQPQVEEKDCEARRPHPPLLRRKGGAIFSIALALSAPGPEC